MVAPSASGPGEGLKPYHPSCEPSSYKGFVLTPHSFPVVDVEDQLNRLWSIGVFLRTEQQSADENRYFRLKGVLADSREDALRQGVWFGRRLINEELALSADRALHIPGASAYRRAAGEQTWHFRRECSFWPSQEFEERPGPLPQHLLCNECLARQSGNSQ